jgi:hypothetical protein
MLQLLLALARMALDEAREAVGVGLLRMGVGYGGDMCMACVRVCPAPRVQRMDTWGVPRTGLKNVGIAGAFACAPPAARCSSRISSKRTTTSCSA